MWVAIINVASWIWHGIHAAADAVVAWLVPLVKWLWNAAYVTGKLIGSFGRRVWGFMRATWDHVLVPAWKKFDKFVTDVHGWLERHFAPLLLKLNELRKRVNDWWKKYISPILTLLDVGRSFLQILARLGVDWARKLDAELARIESLVMRPFLEFNRRLTEVGDWINRIVTLDGLFQRLTLLKSLARDAESAWDLLMKARQHPLSDEEKKKLITTNKLKTPAESRAAAVSYVQNGEGDFAGSIEEWVLQGVKDLGSVPR